LFLGVLAFLPFVIGIFVKNLPIRLTLFFVSAGFLALTISIIRKHSRGIQRETNKFCGTFIIDTARSKYHLLDLSKHKNLFLKVTADKKFYFTGDTISFVKQSGTWKFTDNEDGGYLQCFFGSKKIKAYRSLDNQIWTFESDCLKNSITSDIIYFTSFKAK
jgi:hypothetical protein